MMPALKTLQGLVEQLGSRLELRWLTPVPRDAWPLVQGTLLASAQSLVGSLNCIHPNRLQVLGAAEMRHLGQLSDGSRRETVERLFAARPAAVIFAEDVSPSALFLDAAERTETPLLSSTVPSDDLVGRLQHFLTYALAERTTLHGVFLEVLGTGVLLVGDPGIGKSELALEMVVRGHRLVADDAPEIARVGPETLLGSCSPLLRDFLEVRGLGVLNLRAMFGESAVQQTEQLHLIVNMRVLDDAAQVRLDRLRGSLSSRTILGVSIPEVTLPVAPGRNLAVLLETAVRNQMLRTRGYDAAEDLIARQASSIDETARSLSSGSS